MREKCNPKMMKVKNNEAITRRKQIQINYKLSYSTSTCKNYVSNKSAQVTISHDG